jgi:hypothetical protein
MEISMTIREAEHLDYSVYAQKPLSVTSESCLCYREVISAIQEP